MERIVLFGLLLLVAFCSETKYQPANAATDFPEAKCPNEAELMDGLCVRAYARVDHFDTIEDEDKFEYLIENYCADLQTQPITCAQYVNSTVFDEQALSLYKDLLKKYQDPTVLNGPTVDCLGIARYTFCAYQFAFCDTGTGLSEQVVCQFLCDTWLDRCPEETDLYSLLCQNTRDSRCSTGLNLNGFMIFITFIFLLLIG